jgi:hypothetical protein
LIQILIGSILESKSVQFSPFHPKRNLMNNHFVISDKTLFFGFQKRNSITLTLKKIKWKIFFHVLKKYKNLQTIKPQDFEFSIDSE